MPRDGALAMEESMAALGFTQSTFFGVSAVAMAANTDRPVRGRALQRRRWRVAIASARFAVRMFSLIRCRLTVGEERGALGLYVSLTSAHGSIETRTQIRTALFLAGQLVDDEDVTVLCERVGFTVGVGALQFAQFREMLEARKHRYLKLQETTDTTAAFLSLADPETQEIDTHHLLALCRQFDLSDEVEQLIHETDADGSGRIDMDEFAELLEAQAVDAAGDATEAEASRLGLNVPSNVSAGTANQRRAARAANRNLYHAIKRRLHALNAALRSNNEMGSMRHASSAVFGTGTSGGALQHHQSARLSKMHVASAVSEGAESMNSDDADMMDEEQEQQTARRKAERDARFGVAPYVPEPPPAWPVPGTVYRRSDQVRGKETADRLSPRRPESARKHPTSGASAFGSSSSRFDGDQLLNPLPQPSRREPVQRREHPADLMTIYRTPLPSRGGSPESAAGPSPPHGGKGGAGHRDAPPPDEEPPEYATFNPFLGLPPLSGPSPSKPVGRGGSARRNGSATSSRPGTGRSKGSRGGKGGNRASRPSSSSRGAARVLYTTPPTGINENSPRGGGRPPTGQRRTGGGGDARPAGLDAVSGQHNAANYQLVMKHSSGSGGGAATARAGSAASSRGTASATRSAPNTPRGRHH